MPSDKEMADGQLLFVIGGSLIACGIDQITPADRAGWASNLTRIASELREHRSAPCLAYVKKDE